MPYCIICANDLCVCPRGETREMTIMIDEDTFKAIKEEGSWWNGRESSRQDTHRTRPSPVSPPTA